VYNSGIWANSIKFFYEPREGNYARVTAEYLPDRADTAPEWEKVTCAVGSGPWLLQGGKDVTSRNGDFSDPKLAINKAAARSFAAVMGDGRLLLGVATASFRAIADYLMSIGAKDALALDGGASSTLYVEGGGYPRPAGRKLSNMLHIVDYASGALPQPADAPDLSLPSPWAEKYIADATGKNLIPEGFEPSYQKNITREEFCELVIQLIKLYKGDKYSSFIYLTGVSYEEVSSRFIDTYNLSVLDCSRLNIIDGAGGGRFDPNGSLTRQQAAKILKNVAGIIGIAAAGDAISFDDQSAIASWAAEGVDFVSRAGIMNGKGPIFDPKGYFTKQEAVVTILRLLRP
jgi:hypothetical protein